MTACRREFHLQDLREMTLRENSCHEVLGASDTERVSEADLPELDAGASIVHFEIPARRGSRSSDFDLEAGNG